MTEPKSFLYVVPESVVRTRIKRSVQAWKSSVPGLIVQRPLDPAQNWFHITHEPSGCILKNLVWSVEDALKKIASISNLPIKWTGTAEDIYKSVAALSRKNALVFYEAMGLGRDKDHRNANLQRARNHKRETKNWKARSKR